MCAFRPWCDRNPLSISTQEELETTLDKLETAARPEADDMITNTRTGFIDDMIMNTPNGDGDGDGDGDDFAKTQTKTETKTETESNTLLRTGPLFDDTLNEVSGAGAGAGAGAVRQAPKPLDRALCARRVQDIDEGLLATLLALETGNVSLYELPSRADDDIEGGVLELVSVTRTAYPTNTTI